MKSSLYYVFNLITFHSIQMRFTLHLFLYGVLIPLFLGVLIYILFRTENLVYNNWIQFNLSYFSALNNIRYWSQLYDFLPIWFIYSLPDGLWIFSLNSFIILLWNREITLSLFVWLLTIILLAMCHELLQKFNIIRGTFDIYDMIFYLIGGILPPIIFLKIKTNQNENL